MKTWDYDELTAITEREILHMINRLYEDTTGFDRNHLRSMAFGYFDLWAAITRSDNPDPKWEADSQRLEKIVRTNVPEPSI